MNVGSNVAEASSWKALKEQRERKVNAVMFQVLDNPSLLEDILKHVILGKDGVDRDAACDLRLVDTNWNAGVLRILRQAHVPLFQIRSSDTIEEVDTFIATFAASVKVLGSVPPLAIRGFDDPSLPDNLEIFSNCLTRCGKGLIQLGFRITENGRSFKTGLENWSLPFLYKLRIVVELSFLNDRSEIQDQMAVGDRDHLSTGLIKSVLSNATALTELNLIIHSLLEVPSERSQFTAFESVVLPPSLTKINISAAGVAPPVLELLARSPLPNLTCLTIYLRASLLSDGLLFRILDNCRKSLKTLEIDAYGYNGAAYWTRFPVMEQLQEISIDGIPVQPKLENDESLEKCFPKLGTLNLIRETADVLQKWAASSAVPGVTNLELFLLLNSKASLTMNTMQLVNFAFPNLRKLEVYMTSRDLSGLEYIFREMRQLTDLTIKVDCGDEDRNSSNTWDSILTGVPVEVIAGSRADANFCEKSELEQESLVSIRNLSELKRFSFSFYFGHGNGLASALYEFIRTMCLSISDFLFNFALLRMPKLTEVRLQHAYAYNVSQEMITKWRNEARSLTFQS